MKDFNKYKSEFNKADISLIKNPKVFREIVFHQNKNRITVIADTLSLNNHIAIYFSTKDSDDKFVFNLFQKDYHLLLFALLSHYNFGSSKILQLETFNKIQKSISSYYIDVMHCKFSYRERSQNSILYALTIQLDLTTMFNICIIDEDSLVTSLSKSMDKLVKKDIIAAANINFIYLQYNSKNNRYKIGFSKHPQYREKTLQSEEPEIKLYRQWIASQKYERILKAKFKSKRLRGEWFELNSDDLTTIDKIMSKFYNSIESAVSGMVTKIADNLVKSIDKTI